MISSRVRLLTEERERELLSPHAARACESAGRQEAVPEDPVRTCYQRDRDRVLHSKPFRRLKHKTQVFLDPVGDHYRTRLTHSLEVAQISRTVGRALRLNEDLIEAIALGHDVGHTPFGHTGEAALNAALKELHPEPSPERPGHFSHHEQSLRVVDVLARLNLTQETRAGIGGHSKGRKDLSSHDGEPVSTLEAAVVRICDRIAYLNHDLDDALRSGIIAEPPRAFAHLGEDHGERLGRMVVDVIENSLDQPAIRISPAMTADLNGLKEWLYDNVYEMYPRLYPDMEKARHILTELLLHFLQAGALPEGYEGVQGAIDYTSGMTDRFAIDCYTRLYIPSGFMERIGQVP